MNLEQIAHECAEFAWDNSGDPEFSGCHAPEAMWESWHDKEDTIVPSMPSEWPVLYLAACREICEDQSWLQEVAGLGAEATAS